jgi:hypothetical protein
MSRFDKYFGRLKFVPPKSHAYVHQRESFKSPTGKHSEEWKSGQALKCFWQASTKCLQAVKDKRK